LAQLLGYGLATKELWFNCLKIDDLPQSSAKVKNALSFTSTPPHASMACTDNFSLFFDPKDGDGPFLCNVGTILQKAAGVQDHLPPSGAEVKNEWSCTLLPLYVFMVCMGTVLLLPLLFHSFSIEKT
jgi:hypothetical protein